MEEHNKREIFVLAPTVQQAEDLIVWLNRHEPSVRIDKVPYRITTLHAIYYMFAASWPDIADKIRGINFTEAYFVDNARLMLCDTHIDILAVLNRRRLHMQIPAHKFYKYFNGYFGR